MAGWTLLSAWEGVSRRESYAAVGLRHCADRAPKSGRGGQSWCRGTARSLSRRPADPPWLDLRADAVPPCQPHAATCAYGERRRGRPWERPRERRAPARVRRRVPSACRGGRGRPTWCRPRASDGGGRWRWAGATAAAAGRGRVRGGAGRAGHAGAVLQRLLPALPGDPAGPRRGGRHGPRRRRMWRSTPRTTSTSYAISASSRRPPCSSSTRTAGSCGGRRGSRARRMSSPRWARRSERDDHGEASPRSRDALDCAHHLSSA